jgi:hypothetical protein
VPDLSTIRGGPGNAGSNAAASIGVSVTAHATVNTKGSWTQIIGSTTYASDWLLVSVSTGSSSGTPSYLIDIGVGGSTAEVVLIPNLWLRSIGARRQQAVYLMPISIPSGTRISARCQSQVSSEVALVNVNTIASGIASPPGLSRVEACGVVSVGSRGTTIDAGGTAHTDVIGQLIASTAFDYRWMAVAMGCWADASWGSTAGFLLDIMVGAGGSEVEVIGDLAFGGDAAADITIPHTYCFPCAIAAGSRIAGRLRASTITNSERQQDIIVYGVG